MGSTARRADIRELILDAADVLLSRDGYDGMTMEALAQQVGVAKGTLYLHFNSKQHVVLSRIDRLVQDLLERLAGIVHSDHDVEEKLRRMLVLRVLHHFDGVQHYKLSLDQQFAAIRPAILVLREEHFKAEAKLLAKVLREGVLRGHLAVQDCRATAEALVLCTNALLPLTLSTKDLGRRSFVKDKATNIANLVLDGLRSRVVAGAVTDSAPPERSKPTTVSFRSHAGMR